MKKPPIFNSLWLFLLLNIPKMQTNSECYFETVHLRTMALATTLTCSNMTKNLGHFTTAFDCVEITIINSDIQTFNNKTITLSNSSNVSRINLNNDNIKTIEKDAFVAFPALKTLILNFNKITQFELPDNLEKLSLSNNNISSFANFGNLSVLKWLDVSYNSLQTLGNATFGLTALEQLYLKNNSISVLEPSTFENNKLLILDLSFNKLQEIQMLKLEKLQQLYLNDNFLSDIQNGTLQNLKHLRYLKLGHNKLEILSATMFKGLINLEQLHLNDNLVKRIEPQAFVDLANLTFIDLRGNSVATLENGTFAGLWHLLSLNLTKLSVENILPGAFNGLSALLTLDLSANRIEVLEANTFQGLSGLDNLILDKNPFRVIKADAFLNLDRLTLLTIKDSNIELLQTGMFNGMPALNALEMMSSNLAEIQAGAFNNLHNLITLILGSRALNTLEFKNGTFQGLSKLSVVYFKNLGIKVLGGNAFGGLPKLRHINFQNCTILNITDGAFAGLGELLGIKSSCNEKYENPAGKSYEFCNLSIRGIEAGALGDLYPQDAQTYTYNNLYLSYNKLQFVPKNMFVRVSNMVELALDNNNLQEIEPGAFNALSFHTKPCSYAWQTRILICNTLYLNNNTIKVLKNGTFYNMRNLVTLRLDFNTLEEIEPGAFDYFYFNDNKSNIGGIFNTLHLNNNGLKTLRSNLFSKVVNLSHLRLHNNIIEKIEPNTFNGLSFITAPDLEAVLYLNNNKLTALLNNTFSRIKGITRLSLNNNHIKAIEVGTFNDLSFSEVSPNYNFYKNFKSDQNNANILDLSYNKLTNLAQNAFVGVLNLLTLKLDNNGIKRIEQGAFSSLNQLVVLKLSNNRIENLTDNLFKDLSTLQTLDLSSNKIFSINTGTFTGLVNMKQLLLSNNRIIDVPLGTFNNLTALENLQMGSNKLSQFKTGSFSKLERLKYLNISHNNFSGLNEYVLYPLRNLELLDLDNNNLKYLNYSSLLLHLPSLHFVSINNNNWPCHVLINMIKRFRKERIYYLFNATTQYTEENVDGILCTEHEENTASTSTSTEALIKQAIQTLDEWKTSQNNKPQVNLSGVVNLLTNMNTKFDKLISLQHPVQDLNLSAVLQTFANFTNNKVSDETLDKTTPIPENLENEVTLNLNPVTTMFILLMCISSVTICLVLITNACNVPSKKVKKDYKLRKARSEMELLDTAA